MTISASALSIAVANWLKTAANAAASIAPVAGPWWPVSGVAAESTGGGSVVVAPWEVAGAADDADKTTSGSNR